jgi:uncharacterized protein involved in exopolysaccharide biosynthesis
MDYEEEYVEIDLREYLQLLWDSRYLIIGIFLASLLAGFVMNNFILEPVYQSEAALRLSNSDKSYSQPDTAKSMLTSLNYLQQVNEELELNYSDQELLSWQESNKLTVNNPTDRLVKLSFQDTDPIQAKQVLTELLALFRKDARREYEEARKVKQENLTSVEEELNRIREEIKVQREQRTQLSQSDLSPVEQLILSSNTTEGLRTLQENKLSLLDKRQEIKEELSRLDNLEIVTAPFEPETSIKPNKKLNLAISGILGLMVGVMFVLVRNFLKEV